MRDASCQGDGLLVLKKRRELDEIGLTTTFLFWLFRAVALLFGARLGLLWFCQVDVLFVVRSEGMLSIADAD
jgi:hypothetical protein